MHPVIRIASVAAVASALIGLPAVELLALLALLALMSARVSGDGGRDLLRSLWRMRWLFLALAVIYVAFTPGEPVHPALPGISREGLAEGSRRALVLAVLLVSARLLMTSTAPDRIAAALVWLMQPLRILRFDPQRFGLRLAYALQGVSRIRPVLEAARRQHPQSLMDAAAAAIAHVEREALNDSQVPAQLPVLAAPPLWQWSLPIALFWVLHWAAR